MTDATPPDRKVRDLIERVDELIKYAGNRKEPADAYRAARLLVDEADWHLHDVEAGELKDELVVLVGRRNDDLNRLMLDIIAPEPPRPEGPLPQPGDETRRRTQRSGVERIPPNQRLVTSFPVLHTGLPPRFDETAWRFSVTGLVENRLRWTWREFRALPAVTDVSDFHCVTGWSRLDNRWEGVRFRDVAELAGVKPEATHAIVYGHKAYSANCDLETLMGDDVLFAWGHDGKPLSTDHGGPLRLVLPSRYAWKSVKWVESVQFLDRDVAGYWEARGYHNVADPFLEQRYS